MAGGVPRGEEQNQMSQQPSGWGPGASNTVTVAHCTLLQQLSQDLLDTTSPAELNTGCDSSDCLLCQGQRQFCNRAITNSVCAWLGRRLSDVNIDTGSNSEQPVAAAATCSSSAAAAAQQHAQPQLLHGAPSGHQQQPPAADCTLEGPRKRRKPSPASTPACSTGLAPAAAVAADNGQQPTAVAAATPPQENASQQHAEQAQPHTQPQPQQQQQQALCGSTGGLSLTSSSSSWQWQPAFAAFEGPAPARLVEVARLQSAADASAGHCVGRCDRICGLEFSPDGQLLAAAGVSKQIGLYPLASLAELQDTPAASHTGGSTTASSSTSSAAQRQQRVQQQQLQPHQQQQQTVPMLSPIATLRLPGKVSSIAFSPDMQGVISVGDYDGTLTQVHVASGHFLNEVDAHAGRRIWSVCHSKLRRHFAVTASDDCTARLWSGSGLNTHVGTVMAPGKPAVCGADFSSSNEHLLALAAADAKVYLYDLRQLQHPLAVLHGHRRPVSYAKFFGGNSLVSASIDGSLAVWDLAAVLRGGGNSQSDVLVGPSSPAAAAAAAASGAGSSTCSSSSGSTGLNQPAGSSSTTISQGSVGGPQQQPWKVFRGHTNEKNFVGLSVDPCSGLMAVGSETSDVFAYHTSWSSPLASFDMAKRQQQQLSSSLEQQMQQPASVAWVPPPPEPQQPSVSAVAWQPSCAAAAAAYTAGQGMVGAGPFAPSSLLAAATSTGACKLLTLLHAA